MSTQPGDVTVIATLSIQNSANAPIARGADISDAWINTSSHTTRDALPTAVTTLGTLVRTLNDGIVWEVTSVGPVVYAAWSGSGGVTGLVFQAPTNLIAYDATALPNGAISALETPLEFYELETSPIAAVLAATDGVNIIQPTTPNGYRWLRKGLAYSFVSDWYVDGTGGNDANDGSISAPLKTKTELSHRLFPGGASRTFFQNTTVHVAAGTYADGGVWYVDGAFTLTLQYAFTSGSPITLSAVTNTVAGTTTVGSGTRGQIATAAGTFVVGQMLRCTGGSHVGAIAYVQELNGDAQHAFVTHWHTVGTFGGVQANLTAGDVVVVDTHQVDVGRIALRTTTVSALVLSRLGTSPSSSINVISNPGNVFGIKFEACQGGFDNADPVSGCATFTRCQGSWFSTGGYLQWLRGNHFTTSSLLVNTKIDFSGGDCFKSGGLRLSSCKVSLGQDWAAQASNFGMQFERCGSPCFDLGNTGLIISANLPIWGVTGGTDGFDIGPGSYVTCLQTQLPTVAASVAQVRVGGNGGAGGGVYKYAQMPVSDCGIGAAFLTTVSSDASVPLVTKTALVTATNLYAANPPAGQFAIGACLTILVVGLAGAIAVFAEWTDDTGVAQKRRVTSWLSITAVDNSDGQIMIRTNGTSQVQYSVESQPGTFTITGLQYELSLVCERKAVP